MPARKLHEHKLWAEFAKRYAHDLPRFAIEVCGMKPTWQQLDILLSIQSPGSRTSISSGHGIGKSRLVGVVALWHLVCYYLSNFVITAPKIEQVRNVSWKEISDMRERIEQGPHAWIAPFIVVEAERVYVRGFKDRWFVVAKTAPKGSPENMAGMHRDWLMFWCDEASGIDDKVMGVIGGALTDERNRWAMSSQPTRDSGFFYDTHNKLSRASGGVWNAIVTSSEESPLVSLKFIGEKLAEYGGRDDPQYQIKVLGKFPENSGKYLLSRKHVEQCFGRRAIAPGRGWGHVLSLDVGAGEYRDKTVLTHARVSGYGDFGEDARAVDVLDIPLWTNTRDLDDASGFVFRYWAERCPGAPVLVDAGGMGVAVCQRLERMGVSTLLRVKWGNPCFRKENVERYFNLRAMAMQQASRAAREGRLGLPDGPWRKDLELQATRVPFSFDEKARYKIMSKEDMAKDGLPSPDIWDSISFLFLEGVSYIESEGVELPAVASNRLEDARKRLLAELDEDA
jgi:hypothetical protein